MGELYLHDLSTYIDKYRLENFVETGTGIGTGLSHALRYPFKRLYSIEYIQDLHIKCLERFNDDRLTLLHDSSLHGLTLILEEVRGNTLFWLDAHFPGADFHYNGYDYLDDQPDLHMPLEAEIRKIVSEKYIDNDVFIIDDISLYTDVNTELKNAKELREKYGNTGLDWILELFPNHNFSIDQRHQGFLILTPKI